MDTFGEISETGVVLSSTEMRARRKKRGECESCGQKCFQIHLLRKSIPITEEGKVLNGRCLRCHPLKPAEILQQHQDGGGVTIERTRKSFRNFSLGRAMSDGAIMSSSSASTGNSNSSSSKMLEGSTSTSKGSANKVKSKSFRITSTSNINSISNRSSVTPQTISEDQVLTTTGTVSAKIPIKRDSNASDTHQENKIYRPILQSHSSSSSVLSTTSNTKLQRNTTTTNTAAADNIKRSSSIDESQILKELDSTSSSIQDAMTVLSSNPNNVDIAMKGLSKICQSMDANNNYDDTNNSNHNNNYATTATKMDPSYTTKNIHHHDTLLERKNLATLLSTMDKHYDHHQIQYHSCLILLRLSSISPKSQLTLSRNGAIHSLANVLSTFQCNNNSHDDDNYKSMKDSSIQEIALQTIQNLSLPFDNRTRIIKHGVIRHILTSMTTFIDHAYIQNICCGILGNLSYFPKSKSSNTTSHGMSTTNKPNSISSTIGDIMASVGSNSLLLFEQISMAMIMHSSDETLILNALKAIENLCAHYNDNKIIVVEGNVVDTIVSNMQLHRNNSSIQALGIETLGVIGSIVPKTSSWIGDMGGLDVTIRAMWLHADDIDVQRNACEALCIMSQDKNVQDLMVNVDGIGALVQSMQVHTNDASIVINSCNALSNLVNHEDDSSFQVKLRVVEEEALDGISLSMVIHGNDVKVVESTCALLDSLSCCDENLAPMCAANIPHLLETAASKFPNECKDTAERILSRLQTIQGLYR